mmetsp:Transcript_2635/g.4803  ORF Transcript_2635/g.4803 Transcript_2635/m.4803 type:complete len:287 (-) Transcript_2635:266-1126(-)|eukprot:CAMPEP_0114473226 /NCGR_PEP_ID=MMETSP0104-20121206/12852_1 /TAXON_ID=37642 ORGANISM="Paraphysomonas imperforata, Strain PA2" /NCGR_SAMPLE_ID=MMETSP0104 /ASSEMBLY_ACC=CAM_ASM_000202 /LENGTH=286 /DNA_ID=CAMNT_0001647363 /DNA_START=12 /DNA_END=872 /DNA_ORIENTATION=+
MKKVAASSQSVFDDPLFNPGDSFKQRDSDDCIAPPAKPRTADLVNTLTISDEESFLSKPKPMQRSIKKKAPPASVDKPTTSTSVEQSSQKPKVEKKKVDPLQATSVFDNDGEDLFLPSSGKKTEVPKQKSLEDDLFGTSSSTKSKPVKAGGGSNLRLGTHDSDSDNEINDLGVGAIMEREELDFDMFGKSNVRQFESMETDDSHVTHQRDKNSAVGKDDLVLESNDILSDFESMLSEGNQKKSTVSSPVVTTTANVTAKAIVVDNSSDIDAYISQQQESDGGGLFD